MGISQGQDTINHVEVNDTTVPTASSIFSEKSGLTLGAYES
jgi:hypothetical protein